MKAKPPRRSYPVVSTELLRIRLMDRVFDVRDRAAPAVYVQAIKALDAVLAQSALCGRCHQPSDGLENGKCQACCRLPAKYYCCDCAPKPLAALVELGAWSEARCDECGQLAWVKG